MPGVRVGTSGWSYSEWVGRFYPNGTSPARMLAFYGRRFPCVEAHATYRRVPLPTALQRWTEQVPPEFRFVPKAHLGITHRRDLDGVEERIAAFFAALAPLGPCLGPVLFSVPHQQPDLERLDRLLGGLPPLPRPPVAFELGPAWMTPEVVARLEAHRATLVVVDADGSGPSGPLSGSPGPSGPLSGRLGPRRSVLPEVGPLTYVRLRRSRYDRAALDSWAERLAESAAGGREVYAFFKHDDVGNGPRYARRVIGRLP